MSEGQVSLGLSASFTVIVKLQVIAPLPEGSVAEYETVVVPTGKTLPGAGPVRVGTKLPQLSLAIGSVHDTTEVQTLNSEVIVISAGQISTGTSLSTTETVKEHDTGPLPDGS